MNERIINIVQLNNQANMEFQNKSKQSKSMFAKIVKKKFLFSSSICNTCSVQNQVEPGKIESEALGMLTPKTICGATTISKIESPPHAGLSNLSNNVRCIVALTESCKNQFGNNIDEKVVQSDSNFIWDPENDFNCTDYGIRDFLSEKMLKNCKNENIQADNITMISDDSTSIFLQRYANPSLQQTVLGSEILSLSLESIEPLPITLNSTINPNNNKSPIPKNERNLSQLPEAQSVETNECKNYIFKTKPKLRANKRRPLLRQFSLPLVPINAPITPLLKPSNSTFSLSKNKSKNKELSRCLSITSILLERIREKDDYSVSSLYLYSLDSDQSGRTPFLMVQENDWLLSELEDDMYFNMNMSSRLVRANISSRNIAPPEYCI